MEPNYNPYENMPEGENQTENNQQNFNPYSSHPFRTPVRNRQNLFETMSMTFAIVALVSCTCFYGSYIFGALAILFALLSRGGQMKMSSKAKLGLIVGIVAIVLSTVLTISSLYMILDQYGSFENYLREYSEMMGLDYETDFAPLFE